MFSVLTLQVWEELERTLIDDHKIEKELLDDFMPIVQEELDKKADKTESGMGHQVMNVTYVCV